MVQEQLEVLPDPERVIEGLRDTGYHFETAVADIVDNSIAAEATIVDIRVEMEFDGRVVVHITDNGYGMNRDDLINAMRYGSQTRPSPLSLGKFGLGLKTASTAFCRKLSVVSKDSESDYLKATWDLDHVTRVGKWELTLSEPSVEEISTIKSVAGNGSGTLVVWDKVDRVIREYQDPVGHYARAAIDRKISVLKEHLSVVYQRFLDVDDDRVATHINIMLNGEPIVSWNPFFPSESELIGPESREVEMFDGSTSQFSVCAYILPRRESFSTPEMATSARISNYNQGIYVYRENRLIYGPGWFKIYSKEPHFSLLRVDFSFDHTLDDAFQIDIKKSQVILNETLRSWLRNSFLPAPRRAAEQSYRTGYKKKISKMSYNIHQSSIYNIRDKSNEITDPKVEVVDKGTEEVLVVSPTERKTLVIKISDPPTPDNPQVIPVEGIQDGLLWEPTIVENQIGVLINTAHDYYSKVYIPNKNSSVIIQGLDSLLWALAHSEIKTSNESVHRYMKELRYEVSKLLRILIRDLPEPVIEE